MPSSLPSRQAIMSELGYKWGQLYLASGHFPPYAVYYISLPYLPRKSLVISLSHPLVWYWLWNMIFQSVAPGMLVPDD